MKLTESESLYDDLENMEVHNILLNINKEDQKVAFIVQKSIPIVENLVKVIVDKMKSGSCLFYIGAGTSGRLGIIDASELPPTFGVYPNRVIGIIAGSDQAIKTPVEFAEDDVDQAYKDLLNFNVSNKRCRYGYNSLRHYALCN